MIAQTPGKIFLADERGVVESDRFRRESTFCFGRFAHPHKGPFGRLYGLNEETLAGGHALALPVGEASLLLLLPITGAVAVAVAGQPETMVEVEESRLLALPAGSVLHLRNPYPTDLVSFLHIWLRAEAAEFTHLPPAASCPFELLANKLTPLGPEWPAGVPAPVTAWLGRFAGRAEAGHRLRAPGAAVFVFVLAGAFEVESRLLHAKDGLALWDVAALELEALSHDALLLLLELPPLAGA